MYHSNRGYIVCLSCALVFLFTCHLFIDSLDNYWAIWIGIFFSTVGAFILVINKIKYLKDKNWFSFEILFYTIFWIVHFLVVVGWCLGEFIDEIPGVRFILSTENLSKIVLVSSAGGLAFTLAFLIFSRPTVANKQKNVSQLVLKPTLRQYEINRREENGLYIKKELRLLLGSISTVAAVISLIAFSVMVITAGTEFYLSPYAGAPESYVANISQTIFSPFFRISLILCIVSILIGDTSGIRKLSVVYYAFVTLFFLILGDRGLVSLSGMVETPRLPGEEKFCEIPKG